jgi:hypothetical protein
MYFALASFRMATSGSEATSVYFLSILFQRKTAWSQAV